MARTRNTTPYVGSMPRAVVSQMVAHAASGAAGVHADQKMGRRSGTGRTNRVGSRSAARREAIRQQVY